MMDDIGDLFFSNNRHPNEYKYKPMIVRYTFEDGTEIEVVGKLTQKEVLALEMVHGVSVGRYIYI